MKITVGIADDQQLFLKSMAMLVNSFDGFETVIEAHNGEDLMKKLSLAPVLPDILVLDVNMPVMDGIETGRAVAAMYPQIKMAALSMNDDDTTVINMLKAGACAYLLKDIHPLELEKALLEIATKGYYNADAVNINFRRLIIRENNNGASALTEREISFLKLACSDLTYKQIAGLMHLSERTIDGYRESLFEKMKVQSRVGMALEAIRRKIVTV